jgi:hypothetical protein
MSTVVSAPAERSAAFFDPSPEFSRHFDSQPFEFSHRLSEHPLFSLPRLLKLAQSTREKRPQDLYYDAGNIRIDQRWDETEPHKVSVEEAIENIDSSGVWIILKRAELDPEYGQLLNECMGEAQGHIGRDFRKDLRVAADSIIFITSPNRVTSYHIDRECSFLLQMRGKKQISIFDRSDREVLPEQELERFWSTDNNAARYKPQFENRARKFQMRPGSGVHIPVNSPHWVQNDNNVSISYNINCQFKDRFRANLYRANYALRRAGITPSAPGRYPALDALKRTLGGVPESAKTALKGLRRKP